MATDLETSVSELITSTNIIGEVINGESTETVITESGEIPTLRKALADNLYFKDPIPWSIGSSETNFNQLRTFTDETVWWSPTATSSNPSVMNATPYGDTKWFPWQDRKLKLVLLESLSGFTIKGTFKDGFTYTGDGQAGLDENDNLWIYKGKDLPFVVQPNTVPYEPEYAKVSFGDHTSLKNTSETGSHPASAISTADGRDVEQVLSELPAFVTAEADRAEAAADAASINGKIYATVEEGLLNTNSGDYFSTLSPNEGDYLNLYLNFSDTAVFQKSYPSVEYFENIKRKLLESFEVTGSDYPFNFVDAKGNLMAFIDQESNLHITGLERTVQDEINDLKKNVKTSSTSPSDDICVTIDAKGNVVRKINSKGVEVSHSMSPVIPDNSKPISSTNKNGYSLESGAVLSNLAIMKPAMPPCPWLLTPNKYTIPDSIVNAFTLPFTTNYQPLDTPYYADDEVVHPYIIEMPTNFLGYKYLLVNTPYYSLEQENPVLFGSHDSDNWEMISECPNPIYPSPIGEGIHNSDNSFAYDQVNGLLHVIWRATGAGQNIWLHRATENGVVWSDAEEITPPDPTATNLSPSFLYNPNDGLWHCWYCQEPNDLTYATSDSLTGNWVIQDNKVNFNSAWHLEVKFMGDKYLMLLNSRNADNIFFCISNDGVNWTVGSELIKFTGLYKSTFLPIFDGNDLKFKIYMAVNNSGDPIIEHKMPVNETNTVDISTLTQD